ncbi:hypothetical protein ACH4KN_18545 [Streptomyces sp. NPDC017546]|nr:hypothetical protein [Streptomyces sp. MMBL 11-1]
MARWVRPASDPQEAEPPLRVPVPDGFIDAPAEATALTATNHLPYAP